MRHFNDKMKRAARAFMDGHLVSKPASKAEIELGSSVDSGTPEEAGVLASLHGRLAKQAEEFAKEAARAA